ncbi:hypothetical protein [Paractinoplanes globisporus]|uniref:Uncharacterized protein n=1 Tax=Paractinoplanes globisporus TaxID=113565 RepID=A0ABW6WX67_9ACTN|nr:hypothetical protein [Actinoplanes globisporus]
MVDIEAGEFTRPRRFDVVTAACVVLTVDAALFLLIAVVGVPFLLYIFADDDTGTWQRMWPLISWWLVATALGAASALATVRVTGGGGGAGVRRLGAAAATATAVGVGVLISVTFDGSLFDRALFLAVAGALFVIANVAAALVLISPASAADEDIEIETMESGYEDDEVDDVDQAEFDEPAEPVMAKDTVELARTGPGRAASSAARRRLRRQAAMRTMAGVRMTRRPRR